MDRQPYLRLNFGADTSKGRITVEQIVSVIRAQIIGRTAVAGLRLPPVRVLAHQLHVSKNTVQAAYEELKSQGLIESRNRLGLYITPPKAIQKPISSWKIPSPEFRSIGPLEPSSRTRRGGVNLSSVFIDPDLLPKEKIASCFRSVLTSPGLSFYSDYQGYRPLREKIAERLRKRGIAAEADHIVTTIGSQQALDLAFRMVKQRKIATENPAYHLAKALLEMNDAELVGLPIDPFQGVPLAKWEELIRRERPTLVYLTSNFQNPTGYSYTTAEIQHILELSEKYSFAILEDDWGSDMMSFSEFRPCMRAIGGPSVLYVNSFTKKVLPSFRLGYLLSNEASVETLVNAKRVSAFGMPAIVEATLFEFLDRGYYDSHLKQLHAELDARYRHCLDLLRSLMPPEVRWTTPGGGPVLWVEVPQRVRLAEIQDRLKPKGITLSVRLSSFFAEPHLHGFMIGYAFLKPKELETALEKLAAEIRRELGAS